MKIYSVKEAYVTLQGEGAQTGRAAVFLRFAGCNLWSGLERDRHKAVCQFCDTDFVGTNGENGGKFEGAEALADHVAGLVASGHALARHARTLRSIGVRACASRASRIERVG